MRGLSRSILLATFQLILTVGTTAVAGGTPSAVTSDPPKDPAHPARMEALQIMSHGDAMNAVLYLASGAVARPTVLFFNGSPGNEQNLDLAQAIRRAGWNVLTLHYRGSWGSAGQYSIVHCIEDSQAAIAFMRDPAVIARYNLKAGQIVLAGHSLGAFLAAKAGSTDSGFMGIAVISAWDIGNDAPIMAKWTKDQVADEFDDMPGRVVGATGPSMIAETIGHEKDWSLEAFTPGLAKYHVLVAVPHDDDRETELKFAAKLKALGSPVMVLDVDTDHPFSDARIALETAFILWLQTLPGSPPA
jgi:uncharacterized protein